MKGILALDIDGTLVTHHEALSPSLIDFLESIHGEGWELLFATGRTIRWSMENLFVLPFPFFLAPYNGACLFSFPRRELLRSAVMELSDVLRLSSFISEFGAVIYEADGEERIFYTADAFSGPILDHLRARQERQQEQWSYLDIAEHLPRMAIASVRFFLSPEAASMLSGTIQKGTTLNAPTMKDAFHEGLRIVQVTSRGASKGQALRALKEKYPGVKVIAAGDDMNDLDLIQEADVGIAMASAPEIVKQAARIVALPFGEDPVIAAVRQGMGSYA